jgi:hypothetical protein
LLQAVELRDNLWIDGRPVRSLDEVKESVGVVVRPSSMNLLLHILHYPEQVRVCPQTVWPLEKEP